MSISDKSLPFELIESILIRLPVKSLKRFRAVEKSWRSLIDSEDFAKMHLRRSLQKNSNRSLISGVLGFYWLGLDPLESDKVHSMELDFEYDTKDCFAVSNSCNGMFVVKRDPENPVLWNPFTREFKVLPDCPGVDCSVAYPSIFLKTTYGFGYDSINDDYKVVKVMSYELHSCFVVSEEWIYGLKSDSWWKTKGKQYNKLEWPTHVNGALHSILQTGPAADQLELVAFSVVSEKDYEMSLPGIESNGLVFVFLEVFDGCLALVCNYSSRYDIWVMEEYGVKESWKALLSFPVDPNYFESPLVYPKERDSVVISITSKTLTVFGSRTNSVKKITTPFMFSARLCVETLISPNCWDKRNDKKQDKGRKEMKKKTKKKRSKPEFGSITRMVFYHLDSS